MLSFSRITTLAERYAVAMRHRAGSSRAAVTAKRVVSTAICAAALASAVAPGPAGAVSPPSLKVVGNRLVNASTGAEFVPHGVDWPSFEYACRWGYGYSNLATPTSVGPDDADAAAMASWGINTVRVGLNEGCWLGRDGLPDVTHGDALTVAGYRQAVVDWVDVLNAHGLAVILDLHWSAPPGTLADQQRGMADRQSPEFWSSVASTFKTYPAVMFDAFNEPYSIDAGVDGGYPPPGVKLDVTWACWRDGGCPMPTQSDAELEGTPLVPFNGRTFTVVGMQSLVTAIRDAGANQPMLLGGLDYANDLRQWLAHRPANPDTGRVDDQLVASLHSYEGQRCSDPTCWTAEVRPVASQVPVIFGEFSQDAATRSDGLPDTFDDDLMQWADANVDENGSPAAVGYLMWAWVVPDPGSTDPHIIISDSSYTPRAPNGVALKEHLATRSG